MLCAALCCGGLIAPEFTTRLTAAETVPDVSDWAVVEPLPAEVRLAETSIYEEGSQQSLRFHLISQRDFQSVRLISRSPAAVPLEEFRATLRFNSNIAGVRLTLQLVLPQQIDPRTGQPLTTLLPGDRYAESGEWQTLTVSATAAALDAQLRRVRAELHRSQVDASGAYIQGCVLQVEANRGDTFLDIGELQYGPVITPPDLASAAQSQPIADSVLETDQPENRLPKPETPATVVRVERSQIFVNDSPVFLRLAPDHGESIQRFRELGLNAVWVSDVRDQARQQQLLAENFVVMATPPHPRFDPADFESPLQGLPPLEQTCPLASVFYVGTRVDSSQLPHLMAWTREVRSADRLLRRPLMADMTTGEGIAAREVDLVGIGEHVIGRMRTFGEARNQTFQRRRAASQMTLPWTWLQTEQSSDLSAWRSAAGFDQHPIEPEQLTMQLIAALSGGCRGVGFWKTTGLDPPANNTAVEFQPDAAGPVDETAALHAADLVRETALAVELTNLYLKILEPFLVEGRVERHIAVQTSDRAPDQTAAATDQPWVSAISGSPMSAAVDLQGVPNSADAAMISSGPNSLIIAGYWDLSSQFVPQPMYADQAEMIVAASETASAWRVTATGISSLPRNMTAGGLQLTVPNFDQFAVFLVSSDPNQARQLEHRIRETARRAAEVQVELAQLKYARVLRTSSAIDELGRAAPQTRSWSRHAAGRLDQAEAALARNDLQSAERLAQEAARALRIIQQQYWYAAVKELPTPTASPHTVSFASLPDHWRMLDQIADSSADASQELLPSGNFDNLRMIEEAGWHTPPLPPPTQYRSSADVFGDRDPTQRFLRLLAGKSSSDSATTQPRPSLLVLPPAVDVIAGDLLEIRGRVRLGQRIRPESPNPLMVFDGELGPEFAVRPNLEPSWRTFRMYRQAAHSGPFQISFVLDGSAEVHLDDVSIRRVGQLKGQPPIHSASQTTDSASKPQSPGY